MGNLFGIIPGEGPTWQPYTAKWSSEDKWYFQFLNKKSNKHEKSQKGKTRPKKSNRK